MALDEIFTGVAKRLKIEFEEQAKLLGHPGEVGTGRENVLKAILTKYLPKRYEVDSGFVIDALGNKSEQMDIVIYEADYTPVFEVVEGKKFFPCETVVAVGQVKTDIGSREKIRECLNNISSAKGLDRSNKGTNMIITGPGISLKNMKFDPNSVFRDQIFGFIFCSSSAKPDLVIAELQEFNKTHARKLWINNFVNYNEFLVEYLHHQKEDYLTSDPQDADRITLTDVSLTTNILALFMSRLNEFLSSAHIARPDLFTYCKLDTVLVARDYDLTPSEKK
jgi:Domain of unknown function (DUF6602)